MLSPSAPSTGAQGERESVGLWALLAQEASAVCFSLGLETLASPESLELTLPLLNPVYLSRAPQC